MTDQKAPDQKAQAAIANAAALASGMPHPAPPLADLPQIGPAESACNRLIGYIRNFERQLDGNQEIAMGFAGSDAGVLKIEGLGFYEPDLLTFYGRDHAGLKTQLVQHISQLSVLLRAVPKTSPETPALRIGFHLTSGWGGGESGDGSA